MTEPAETSMPDIGGRPVVLLSHRGPVSFSPGPNGRRASRGGGGLVTALIGLVGHLPDAVWVCAATSSEDEVVAAQAPGAPVRVLLDPEPRLLGDTEEPPPDARPALVRLVAVDDAAHTAFYTIIANPLLWFIQHGLYGLATAPDLTRREHEAFEDGYAAVNAVFADAVVEQVRRETDRAGAPAVVMLHDYHFYLVAEQVRAACPDVLLSHFVHIPWPDPDAWRVLPPGLRDRLLRGLLGNDVVAFHTLRFARNFLLCAQELLGLPVDLQRMSVRVGEREVLARHYPISVDVASIEAMAGTEEVAAHVAALREDFLDGDRQLVLRVDRTDPSKNIVRGFRAFGTMLADHPEHIGRVTFLAMLQSSRQDVPEYADYLAEIGGAVAEVNARHGAEGWQPIDLRIMDDLPFAVAAYSVCDVLLVNALNDGMNLVAKEAVVVNQRDGILALSENTGAHEELGRFALTVYPFDLQQTADVLHAALTMDRAERRSRREAAAEVVRHNDVGRWLRHQLVDLLELG